MPVIKKWKNCPRCRGVGNLGTISTKNKILAGMETIPCNCVNGMVEVTYTVTDEADRIEWKDYYTHLDNLFKLPR